MAFGSGLNVGLVRNVLLAVIFLIIGYQVLADTAGDIDSAAGNITAQNDVYPLTSFFKQKGIILLALMAGVVLVMIAAFMPGK